MSIEDESWRTKFSESSEGKDREGYRPSNGENSTGERKMSANGRVLRPRISRPAYSSNASRETRSYQPGASREGGYQPRQVREGNYQPNPRYQQREGGYQPRQTNEDSYQPNPRYQQREGGYQPRQNKIGRAHV